MIGDSIKYYRAVVVAKLILSFSTMNMVGLVKKS
jgi:hypothetical protein